MNLLIHDLTAEKWTEISGDYEGWTVISDNGKIKPCTGCFSCWAKTPGQCIITDGYDNMGYLIHHSDEVTVISRYTYGGFSGFVKNVFDRCLGYVLPQFEVINGETHHQKRYDEDKPFTFIFYGSELNSEEKESARKYVTAVCANIRGHVKDVIFRQCDDTCFNRNSTPAEAGKTVLLNASMRWKNGNSAKLAQKLSEQLNGECETIALTRYAGKMAELFSLLKDAETVVLCMPLYVDGLPSQLIRFMEQYEHEYHGPAKRIYVLANMGLYESSQLENLFAAVRQWCKKMSFEYCGGLGVSAGELIGVLMETIPFSKGPSRNSHIGMQKLADAINSHDQISDIMCEPWHFPRKLYILIANKNWNNLAKKNGIDPKDLYRQL